MPKISITKALQAQLGTSELAESLFKRPPKEKLPLHHYADKKDVIHQIDLLYLPHDNDAKYALVVVDVFSGLTDAEPMTGRTSTAAKSALQAIYHRGVLKPCTQIQTDPGTEFKGAFHNYIVSELKIDHRVGEAGRHRQQSLVESRNKIIGKAILMRQTAREQVTGHVNTAWVRDLRLVIDVINAEVSKTLPQRQKKVDEIKKPGPTLGQGEILEMGTRVRVKLDNPESHVTGRREHGGFRAGDARWSTDVYVIDNVVLMPHSPPVYRLKKYGKEVFVNFTAPQLQVVDDRHEPDASKLDIDPANQNWQISKIIEREKRGGRWWYRVKWIGYSETSWEPRASLPEAMVREFDARQG